MMYGFEFGIAVKGGLIIATFLNEHDRDVAIDTMREEFDDCEFDTVEIE